MTATISVLIPAYNEEKLIGACLNSLALQISPPDEILVVDNASSDSTPQIVQSFIDSHKTLNVKMIREPKKGCTSARESGWRATSGEVIVHVDADEVFPKDWMQRVRKAVDQYPEAGLIGGAIRFDHPPLLIGIIQFLYNHLNPYWVKWQKGYFYLIGGMLICRRTVLEATNGYVGAADGVRDDKYLCVQATKLGFKLRYMPSIYAIHSLRRYEQGGLSGYISWENSDVR